MENQFLDALKHIERIMGDGTITYSNTSMDQLDDLACAMVNQTMMDTEYLKLMALYGKKYQQMDNIRALRYCVMRMQQVLWYRKRKEKQREYPRLIFSNGMDPDTRAFLKQFPSYLHTYEDRYKKRIIKYATLLYIAVLLVFVLFLKMHFIRSLVFGLLLYFGILFYAFHFGYPTILKDQMRDLIRSLDTACRDVDVSVRKRNLG